MLKQRKEQGMSTPTCEMMTFYRLEMDTNHYGKGSSNWLWSMWV